MKDENSLGTDNSEVQLNISKNAWVPQFRTSPKLVTNSEVKFEVGISQIQQD